MTVYDHMYLISPLHYWIVSRMTVGLSEMVSEHVHVVGTVYSNTRKFEGNLLNFNLLSTIVIDKEINEWFKTILEYEA